MAHSNCIICGSKDFYSLIDLGFQPLANSLIPFSAKNTIETFFPLEVVCCKICSLFQTGYGASPKTIFSSDYVYFSSVSEVFVNHAKNFATEISTEMNLLEDSFVVEVASNDGYFLQFIQEMGIPCLGVEPTNSTASVAIGKGIETKIDFFSEQLALKIVDQYGLADLIVGNNVIAHVPDLLDFLAGIKTLLKKEGRATFEFPYFTGLLEQAQFDTIYHEHYSYLSLTALTFALEKVGCCAFKVDRLNVHGGSLRVHVCRADSGRVPDQALLSLLEDEKRFLDDIPACQQKLEEKVNKIVFDLLFFLSKERLKGKKIAAFGAAAKGNTLLNYCGIKRNLIQFVCDDTASKQYCLLPGSRLPVYPISKLKEEKPDIILILPWNWRTEIQQRLDFTKEWGAQLVVACPELEVL